MHLVHPHPPKFCITIVFDVSHDDCNTQEKLKQWLRNFGGINKMHYGLCENGESHFFSLRCRPCSATMKELKR